MNDTTQTIWRSAARFFSGTMLSRITGLLRDMAMAYAFGTQSVVAALLVAFRFAHLLRRLLGEGAMQTALIPHFEELRTHDKQRAGRFFCDLASSLTLLLIILIAVIMLGIGSLLSANVFSEGNAEIAWLTLLMMPSLLFICLFGINASLLQCEKSYFIPSAAPVVFNLFWILGIACTFFLPTPNAMSFLSLFIVAACFAQWAITLPRVYALIKQYGITHLCRGSKLFSADVWRLGKPLALGIIGVGASQINNALDAVFARWADAEGPALLWYAIRLQQLPLALFGIALSGALLPPLARALKANLMPQFRSFLNFALVRTLALMIPITAMLFLLGDQCIALIYGHGKFTNASVVGTTQCLWGYSAGLVPMAIVLVLAPAFYAKGDYKTPSMAATASMGLNIGINTLMVAGLGLGAGSIAFTTSISAWVNMAWLLIVLARTQMFRPDMQQYGLILSATFIACLGVIGTEYLLGEPKAFLILQGQIPDYEFPFLKQIVQLGAESLIFIGIFALAKGFKPLFLSSPKEGELA